MLAWRTVAPGHGQVNPRTRSGDGLSRWPSATDVGLGPSHVSAPGRRTLGPTAGRLRLTLDATVRCLYSSYMNDSARATPLDLIALLHTAYTAQAEVESKLGALGLSLPKLLALKALTEAGESLPLGQLAERLSCVKSNITQLVDRLEADGLVARKADPADRRTRLAVLTAKGRKACADGSRVQQQTERDLLATLSRDETPATRRPAREARTVPRLVFSWANVHVCTVERYTIDRTQVNHGNRTSASSVDGWTDPCRARRTEAVWLVWRPRARGDRAGPGRARASTPAGVMH